MITKETLINHIAQGKTLRNIGIDEACAISTVRYWMKQHNITNPNKPGVRPYTKKTNSKLCQYCGTTDISKFYRRHTINCKNCHNNNCKASMLKLYATIREQTCKVCKVNRLVTSGRSYTCPGCTLKGRRRSTHEKHISELIIAKGYTILANSKLESLELDIYIPELNLAIEVNGITHYKPIFGEAKLKRTQELDTLKAITCAKHNIKFISLDISKNNKSAGVYTSLYQEFIDSLM